MGSRSTSCAIVIGMARRKRPARPHFGYQFGSFGDDFGMFYCEIFGLAGIGFKVVTHVIAENNHDIWLSRRLKETEKA